MTTKEITLSSKYYSSPSAFFSNFSSAFNSVKQQVFKLETRQVYIERDNPSYNEMISGKMDEALKILPDVRGIDNPLYESLKRRKVSFIRCRPIEFPLTDYLIWEIACYNHNLKMGEKIYFLDIDLWRKYFQDIVQHDYMVFDSDIAFIHDYNENGEITGGWKVEDKEHMEFLISTYNKIKSMSQNYVEFLNKHGIY